jgi:hypothetical protein
MVGQGGSAALTDFDFVGTMVPTKSLTDLVT